MLSCIVTRRHRRNSCFHGSSENPFLERADLCLARNLSSGCLPCVMTDSRIEGWGRTHVVAPPEYSFELRAAALATPRLDDTFSTSQYVPACSFGTCSAVPVPGMFLCQ
jgi:hypothetical protein